MGSYAGGNVFLIISLGVIIVGVGLSVLLARLAAGGVLATFTVWLTVGIAVFGLHHMAELLAPAQRSSELSEFIEAVATLVFLVAAARLVLQLRRLSSGQGKSG